MSKKETNTAQYNKWIQMTNQDDIFKDGYYRIIKAAIKKQMAIIFSTIPTTTKCDVSKLMWRGTL